MALFHALSPSASSQYFDNLNVPDADDGAKTDAHLLSMLEEVIMAGSLVPLLSLGGSDYNIFTGDETPLDEAFIAEKIMPESLHLHFYDKLKQVFVLSAAGKPIYSLNGDDDILLGYMGIITTVMASFHDNLDTEFRAVSGPGFRMVVMNKFPLVLVAISKVPYEVPAAATSHCAVLERQLKAVHNYLLAVISKPVISKNFEGRLNYDLRTILSAQDYDILTSVVMRSTYAFSQDEDSRQIIDDAYFFSLLLGDSLQSVRLSYTVRSKLNELLLACKTMKANKDAPPDHYSLLSPEQPKLLAADLLFGLVTVRGRIMNYLRPQNHKLPFQDISTLLAIVAALSKTLDTRGYSDLWIPICMPNFNSSGFLYCYIRRFSIPACQEPLTVILMSGNKNSFFEMKTVAERLISEILSTTKIVKRLGQELTAWNSSPVASTIGAPAIKHFIYKNTSCNLFFVEETNTEDELSSLCNTLQLVHCYSSLISSLADAKHDSADARNLTYLKWHQSNDRILGFLLKRRNYEFYCLCDGAISSERIIYESRKVIKWCEKYSKRLFIGKGVTF